MNPDVIEERIRWTTTDLALLPESSSRYEIIDGELFVTPVPHWQHQNVSGNIFAELRDWSLEMGIGESVIAPGLVFSDVDSIIPDVVWISKGRLAAALDESGHLVAAPELVIEVLSAGTENERRDREAKLKLYSVRGVQEYWIINWQLQQVEIYRRQQAMLKLVTALLDDAETITSPLLPNFTCSLSRLFV